MLALITAAIGATQEGNSCAETRADVNKDSLSVVQQHVSMGQVVRQPVLWSPVICLNHLYGGGEEEVTLCCRQ